MSASCPDRIAEHMHDTQGTTTNGHCLLPFKTGAFLAGAPVQPVVIRYTPRSIQPSWESMSAVRHVGLLLANLRHKVSCSQVGTGITGSHRHDRVLSAYWVWAGGKLKFTAPSGLWHVVQGCGSLLGCVLVATAASSASWGCSITVSATMLLPPDAPGLGFRALPDSVGDRRWALGLLRAGARSCCCACLATSCQSHCADRLAQRLSKLQTRPATAFTGSQPAAAPSAERPLATGTPQQAACEICCISACI